MKKVLISLLLTLAFLVHGKANDFGSMPSDAIKITITVEIGKPLNCSFAFAICKIDVGVGLVAGTAESFPNGSGGGGGGSWKLSIPRENFAKQYPGFLDKLDGKSSVSFEYSYTLPSNVQNALGSKNVLVIQGNVPYPLKYENGEFVITLPL